MNRVLSTALLLVTLGAVFLAGAWVGHRPGGAAGQAAGRKILHWVDPMHPSYTSDKPGIAPDCGMQLEPVYADGAQAGGGTNPQAMLPPGTVQVSAEQQQLVGVKLGKVERTSSSQNLRLLGRVVPDELRTYVINATIDGWITGIGGSTTGSIVKKNEVLATFYSSEFLSAGQALIYALNSMDRSMNTTPSANQAQKDQMQQFNVSLKQYRDALRNLGMGELQIQKMIETRKYMENVDITSPGSGLIVARNVSAGQRFERGKELYRIADLSRVWVLVDTYGLESEQMKPGARLKVSLPNRNKTFLGRVSSVPPVFDPASRTLKVRLEVDNPDYLLRPDMFVDVDLPNRLPDMLAVPSEALLDSGLKKTVFVERAPGSFEPREVETGRSFAGRVEIISGLREGERIAISGTFLLDSESRMKTAAAGISSVARQDPVCGMYVDEAKARAAGRLVERGGTTNFFCSEECRQKFLKLPASKTAQAAPAPAAAAKKGHDSHQHQGEHPPAPAAAMPAGMAHDMDHKP
jgi:membrane fusion protein, copper/silver efflux system